MERKIEPLRRLSNVVNLVYYPDDELAEVYSELRKGEETSLEKLSDIREIEFLASGEPYVDALKNYVAVSFTPPAECVVEKEIFGYGLVCAVPKSNFEKIEKLYELKRYR